MMTAPTLAELRDWLTEKLRPIDASREPAKAIGMRTLIEMEHYRALLRLVETQGRDTLRWQWFRARAQVGVGEDADPFIAAWVGNEDGIPGLTDEQFTSLMEGDAGYAALDHAAAVDAIADAAMSSLPHEEDRTSAPTLRKE